MSAERLSNEQIISLIAWIDHSRPHVVYAEMRLALTELKERRAAGEQARASLAQMPAVVEEVANKLRTIQMLMRMGRLSMVEWTVLDHSIEQLDALVEEQSEHDDS